jgi:hypothetical protein
MLFFRENPCHLWLWVHRATTAGLEQCGETAWETIPYGDLRRSLFGGVGTCAGTDGATDCAAVDPRRAEISSRRSERPRQRARARHADRRPLNRT